MPATIDLEVFTDRDRMAANIAEYWNTWDNLRSTWLAEKKEIQDYVFATSTRNTTNASLPWKNKVHIPKLCQIRDNLHANYMATLFPNDNSLVWEGDSPETVVKEKQRLITSYMKNKMKQSKFRTEVSKLVLDYIDYGNVFAMTVFEADYTTDKNTGERTPVYVGPRLVRVAPEDIVFDPIS